MASINETREKLRKEIQELFKNLSLEWNGNSPADLQPEKLKSLSRLSAELAKKTAELELLLSVSEEVRVEKVIEYVSTPASKVEVVEPVKIETPPATIPVVQKVEPKIETPVSPTTKNFPDLKSMIGFNERLMFLNQLFKKDALAYEAAITQINNCHSLDEATAFLSIVGAERKWNSSSEPVFIFNSIVKRRFA